MIVVRQGQSLGPIGFSGDTGYFRDYRRIIGASSIGIGEGLLHTGDLIQAR